MNNAPDNEPLEEVHVMPETDMLEDFGLWLADDFGGGI